ncbi:MAG TPA: hypothetical protein VIX59_17355 [Candidatus Binataceae bacterium]
MIEKTTQLEQTIVGCTIEAAGVDDNNDGRNDMQSANHLLQQGLKDNPEVAMVLEIAARAREVEARELPKDIGFSTEVTATPAKSQAAV